MAHFPPISERRFPLSSAERGYFTAPTQHWQTIIRDPQPSPTYHQHHQEWSLSSQNITWSPLSLGQPSYRPPTEKRPFALPMLRQDYPLLPQPFEETIATPSPPTHRNSEIITQSSSPTPSGLNDQRAQSHESPPVRRRESTQPKATEPDSDTSVKAEPDDPGDCFIMEYVEEPSALSRCGLGLGAAPIPPPRKASGLVIANCVPIRANNIPPEMKVRMHTLRLNPFAHHNGVDRGVIQSFMPEPGPLEEEPRIFEFQLDLNANDKSRSDITAQLPPDTVLRAFSPDFEIGGEVEGRMEEGEGEGEEKSRWKGSTIGAGTTASASASSSWDVDYYQDDEQSSSSSSCPPTTHHQLPSPSYARTRYDDHTLSTSTSSYSSSAYPPTTSYEPNRPHIPQHPTYPQPETYTASYAISNQQYNQSRRFLMGHHHHHHHHSDDNTPSPWSHSTAGFTTNSRTNSSPSSSSSIYPNSTSQHCDVSGIPAIRSTVTNRRWPLSDPIPTVTQTANATFLM